MPAPKRTKASPLPPETIRIQIDFRVIVVLFVVMRVILLIVYQPQFVVNPAQPDSPLERGITVYGDFTYHFGIARNADSGLLPYRDFWYEYPPLIPILSGAVYSISGPNFATYATLLALILIAFDTGNLLLVRRIGARLYGESAGITLAVLYALMIAPLVLVFWNFEAVITFAVLAAIALLIDDRARRDLGAAVIIALGALTKLVPLLLIATAWRFRVPRRALWISGISLALTAVGFGAVAVFGRDPYRWPSLTAQFNKPSYQTVWALLDRNYATGAFDVDRLDPAKALNPRGNPPVIAGWLRAIIFGGIGIAAFLTSRRRDAWGLVDFSALLVCLFYLWSSGWSTQWQALLIPLLLLTLPDRIGVWLCVSLAIVSFIEYPLLFAHAGGETLPPTFIPLFTLTVLARTTILAGWGVMLWITLREKAAA